MTIFNTKTKAVLFCRVSSKEQEETGYSLPAQEKYLRDYSGNHTLDVDRVFAISESASGRVQRKTFNEMIAYIRTNKIPVIVVETTDRLTRNFADVPIIDKWLSDDEANQIHLAKEGCVLEKNSKSHECFMWWVKVATAEYYVKLLSENVKKGQKEKLFQGWLPTTPPIGYLITGDKGHKIHIVDETKAPLVKKMFELYASGNYSLKKLTETMTESGLRNNNDNRLVKSRIHQYLTDPFYIGKNRWNGQLYEGKQEVFINKEVFNKVQLVLKSKTTPKYRKHNFLFKSLIKCAECEGSITWEIHKAIVYGHCNHYRECSQKVWVTDTDLEGQLVSALSCLQVKNTRLAEWIRKALKESQRETVEYYSSSIDELNSKLKTIEQRFEKIYDDKIDGKISEDFYNKKFAQYSTEKEETTEAIKKHAGATTKYYELAVNIYELSQRAKEIYLKTVDTAQKRQLLRLVFEKMSLNEGTLSYEYSNVFKILSQAVMETNSSKVSINNVKTDGIFEPQKTTEFAAKSDDSSINRPIWLAKWDDFRQADWSEIVDTPDLILQQTRELLQIANA